MDVDLLGTPKRHDEKTPAGPVSNLASGTNRIRIW